MGDRPSSDCIVTFIEGDIFSIVNKDDIVETFMVMRKSKVKT